MVETHAEFLRRLGPLLRDNHGDSVALRLQQIADELELGRNVRPRDSRGWRVPTSGSKSRRIYDLLVKGRTTGQIALRLRLDVGSVRVLAWKIRNPEADNALRRPK